MQNIVDEEGATPSRAARGVTKDGDQGGGGSGSEADLRQNENEQTSEASVPMVHTMPDLKVTQKLAQKLGHDDTRRLLADRKLVLLVDLDHTVIHTTDDTVPDNIKGIYHFQLYGPHSPWYHTRLRPGTAEFLERMSQLYELHICTFGKRKYAHKIAQLLDPEGKYFSTRILSRDESFNATSKTDNLKWVPINYLLYCTKLMIG